VGWGRCGLVGVVPAACHPPALRATFSRGDRERLGKFGPDEFGGMIAEPEGGQAI
jgi:hypothetical protein